jgi:hypothetical protein
MSGDHSTRDTMSLEEATYNKIKEQIGAKQK